MSQPMLNTRCFVNVVKIKESLITNVEAKILSFMLVKNKQISTLDFSGSIDEDMKNFGVILARMDKKSKVKFITLNDIQPCLTYAVESFSKALKNNTEL
jgi:hypothetical protein